MSLNTQQRHLPFLSTLSLRRATLAGPSGPAFLYNFYPRSPCGERPLRHCTTYLNCSHFYPRSPCGERPKIVDHIYLHSPISIHALLAESDGVHYDNYNLHCVISIHALLAESDQTQNLPRRNTPYFYPRSPCGERHLQRLLCGANSCISIHALLAESDHQECSGSQQPADFYPRSPCGERLSRASRLLPVIGISIHALLAESDSILDYFSAVMRQFLSTLSLRRATVLSFMFPVVF